MTHPKPFTMRVPDEVRGERPLPDPLRSRIFKGLQSPVPSWPLSISLRSFRRPHGTRDARDCSKPVRTLTATGIEVLPRRTTTTRYGYSDVPVQQVTGNDRSRHDGQRSWCRLAHGQA